MLTMRPSPMGGVAVPGYVWLWLCHHGYGDAGGRVAAAVPQPGRQCWGTGGCAAVSVAMPGHAWPWPRRDGDKAGWLPCPSALPAPWVSLPGPSRFCQIRVPQGLARLHMLPTSPVPGTHGDQGHVSPGAGLGARWDPAILHSWVPPSPTLEGTCRQEIPNTSKAWPHPTPLCLPPSPTASQTPVVTITHQHHPLTVAPNPPPPITHCIPDHHPFPLPTTHQPPTHHPSPPVDHPSSSPPITLKPITLQPSPIIITPHP